MDIVIIDKFDEEDYTQEVKIQVKSSSGDIDLSFHDGESEDNNISRNFNDILKIEELLEIAFNAGKSGEELNITYGE